MNEKKICLFGGTFNPVHNGHLYIARSVAALLDADLVLFIPSGMPPHKDAATIPSGKHRLAMLRLALSGSPQFKACDIEIKRSGPSFTIDTIDLLRQDYPDARLIFIVGMDAFIQLNTWKEPERLLTLCDFALISRLDYPFSLLSEIGALPLTRLSSSIDTDKLKALDQGKRSTYSLPMRTRNSLHLLSVPHIAISGTTIRQRIASGESLRNVLPHSVESYIIENEIYLEEKNY